MNSKIINFSIVLLGGLSLIGLIHLGVLYAVGFSTPPLFLILGYGLNVIMALVIYVILKRFADRKSKNLGILFLIGSTLKFAVYFIVFQPLFSEDGSVTGQEFFSFFIPYFACLLLETYAVAKLLKEMD